MTVPFHKSPAELENHIGHEFRDKALLKMALTHSSTGETTNYERIEFLGDRVLGLVVSEILYEKFADEKEGDLAKRLASLVQGSWLAKIAMDINLGEYMSFSESERCSGGGANVNLLADGLEALIGAMYLDAGLPACRDFITRFWGDAFYEMKKPPQHPKTALQEWAQGQGLPLPTYKIINQSGPDHAPVFDIELNVQGYDRLIAQGRSRQIAEKEAAKAFIEKYGSTIK
ncbi:MAG: ribonuclease III [Alphaproteobacteria bacterium]